MGYWVVAILMLALVAGILASRMVYRRDQSFADVANALQAVLTAAALLLAGYWYFVERRGQPHADIAQVVSVVAIKKGFVAVESQISIKNLGQILLNVDRAIVRLQQVSPPPDPPGVLVPEKLAALGRKQWPEYSEPDERGLQLPMFSAAELQWPSIKVYDDAVTHEIEPDESDVMIATFILPCTIKTVRIAAYVRKNTPDGDAERWWRSAAFANLTEACEGAGS